MTGPIPPPGYRLPDETRLGPVRLQVRDLARSLGYYEQVLGLRAVEHDSSGAVLAAPGGERPLLELREKPGALPVPRGGLLGLYHFAIRVPLGVNTWSHGEPADDDHARLLSWDLVVPRPHDGFAAAESLVSGGYDVHVDNAIWIAADPWGTSLRIVPESSDGQT